MINNVSNISTDVPSSFENLSARMTPESQRTATEYIKKFDQDPKTIVRNDEQNKKVDYKELETEIRNILQENNLAIQFMIDDSTKKMIMKLIDEDTREIVKQFPSEVSLQIARFLTQTLDTGQITNAKV